MPQLPPSIAKVAHEHNRAFSALQAWEREALDKISKRSIKKLEAELSRQDLDPKSFRAWQARIALAMASVAQAEVVDATEEVLIQAIGSSKMLGHSTAIKELDAWAAHHGGELRAVNLAAVLELDAGLLIDSYQQSLKTYGAATSLAVRQALTDAAFTFTGRDQLVDQVATIIGRERWRADRIVRTEMAQAYNASFHQSLVQTRNEGIAPDVKKTCIVTRDHRTAQDSYPLDGQVRELEELFVDGAGRSYLHPPGRPNDREKEVAWLPPFDSDDFDYQTFELEEELEPVEGETPTRDQADQVAEALTFEANKRREQRGQQPLETPPLAPIVYTLADERDKLLDEVAKRNRALSDDVRRSLGLTGDPEKDIAALRARQGLDAAFPPSLDELVVVSKLGGSTGAELVQDSLGRRFVRKLGGSPEHLEEEMRADSIYQALGANVPTFRRYVDDSGRPVKLAQFVEGESLESIIKSGNKARIAKIKKALQSDLIVDALLANWDVAGLSLDNVLVTADDVPYRIDNGGALRFRAQGAPKGQAFSPHPVDAWTLRDKNINSSAATVFGAAGGPRLWSQARTLGKRAGEDFLKTFDTQRLDGVDMPRELRDILAARAAELREMGALDKTLGDDKFGKDYRDDFLKHVVGLRHTGYTARLPTLMQPDAIANDYPGDKRVATLDPTNVRDSEGVRFDKLRGEASATIQLAEYMKAQGGDYRIIDEYTGQQGNDSWSNAPRAFKWHWTHVARSDIADPKELFFWKANWGDGTEDGYENSKEQYDKYTKRWGKDAFTTSHTIYHAATYELLRKADMPCKNPDGTLTLIRTENRVVPQTYFPRAKLGDTVNYRIGPMESASSFTAVYVYGDQYLEFPKVPIHRVIGTYLTESDPGSGRSVFLGDRENEFATDLQGVESKWLYKEQ